MNRSQKRLTDEITLDQPSASKLANYSFKPSIFPFFRGAQGCFILTLIINIIILLAISFTLSPMVDGENGYTSWYEKSEYINRCSYNDEPTKSLPYRYDFGSNDDIYSQQGWPMPTKENYDYYIEEDPVYTEEEIIFYADECEYRTF